MSLHFNSPDDLYRPRSSLPRTRLLAPSSSLSSLPALPDFTGPFSFLSQQRSNGLTGFNCRLSFYPPALLHAFIVTHLFFNSFLQTFADCQRLFGYFKRTVISGVATDSRPIIDSTHLHWRVDEQAIGNTIRNMDEEREEYACIHASTPTSRQNADFTYETENPTTSGSFLMAGEPITSTTGRLSEGNKRIRRTGGLKKRVALASALAALPSATAQSCISLAGSTTCSAFSAASISTDPTLVGLLYVHTSQTYISILADHFPSQPILVISYEQGHL